MPIIRMTLMQGYDDQTRIKLSRRLTDAVLATIAAPSDGVTVAIDEVQPTSYMRGRQARVPGAPLPDPGDLVKAYLAALEARNLERARELVTEDFVMTFPGNNEFTQFEELVTWSKTRYQSLTKTFDSIEECFADSGVVVYCYGTLAGEWLNGTTFSGIRFIDRFEFVAGKISRQMVWNDLDC